MFKTEIREDQWKQLRNKIKTQWNALTEDDVKRAEGSTEVLADILCEKYGYTREKAMQEIHNFVQKNATPASKP
jgi:uncharacterized protein YjbJ (UPF0337 family)